MVVDVLPSSPVSKKRCTLTSFSLVNSCSQKQVMELKESECEFVFLTDPLLIEILIRLPSNRISQFKVVCKHWCSLISSSHFFNCLVKHAPETNTFTLVFQYLVNGPAPVGFLNRFYSVGAFSNHPMLSRTYKSQCIDLSFLPHASRLLEPFVVASCQDLLLCLKFGTFYVVNLVTQKWIGLPVLPTRDHDLERTLLKLFSGIKPAILCYHDENEINSEGGCGRFKVIIIQTLRSDLTSDPPRVPIPPESYASQFEIRVFCSESRRWTDLIVEWYPLLWNAYLPFTPILAHKGMLHWLNGRSLVSLDRHMKLPSSINLPDELVLQRPIGFGVCQGKFRVARRIDGEGIDHAELRVWELEDYRKGVWQLAHLVLLHHTSLRTHYFKFIAFHPYNPDIIFLQFIRFICQFNLRTGELKRLYKVKIARGGKLLSDLAPVPPLLHQHCPTPLLGSNFELGGDFTVSS